MVGTLWKKIKFKANSLIRLSIILVIVVATILSTINISAPTSKVTLSSPTYLMTSMNEIVAANVPHYNFKLGLINLSTGSGEVTFGFFLKPFSGLNPVYAGPINYSQINYVPTNLAQVLVYQISSDNNTSVSLSVPFVLSNVSFNSPQGLMKINVWEIGGPNVQVLDITPPGDSYIQSFPASYVLGQYPGYHTFYLNFTLTIYSTLGPYKFPSQSKNVHLEYNNTIIV